MTRDDLRWKRIHVVPLAVSRHIHRSGIQRSNVESVSSRAERFPSDGALGPSQKRLLIFPRRKRRRFVRKHLVSPSYGSLQIRSFPFFLPSPAILFPFLPSFLPLFPYCATTATPFMFTPVCSLLRVYMGMHRLNTKMEHRYTLWILADIVQSTNHMSAIWTETATCFEEHVTTFIKLNIHGTSLEWRLLSSSSSSSWSSSF